MHKCGKRLKVYFDWEGVVDRPSEYCHDTNEIYINPVYYDSYPQWMWFIPLTHEVCHWLIGKLPCTFPEVMGRVPIGIFHAKLEVVHCWIMRRLFP